LIHVNISKTIQNAKRPGCKGIVNRGGVRDKGSGVRRIAGHHGTLTEEQTRCQAGTSFRKTCFRQIRNDFLKSDPGTGCHMFKENNVSGKHVSFQANTKWNFFSGDWVWMFKENNVSGKHVSCHSNMK
jgi:hypothetical protein